MEGPRRDVTDEHPPALSLHKTERRGRGTLGYTVHYIFGMSFTYLHSSIFLTSLFDCLITEVWQRNLPIRMWRLTNS
jgi:hypothetical protein